MGIATNFCRIFAGIFGAVTAPASACAIFPLMPVTSTAGLIDPLAAGALLGVVPGTTFCVSAAAAVALAVPKKDFWGMLLALL